MTVLLLFSIMQDLESDLSAAEKDKTALMSAYEESHIEVDCLKRSISQDKEFLEVAFCFMLF